MYTYLLARLFKDTNCVIQEDNWWQLWQDNYLVFRSASFKLCSNTVALCVIKIFGCLHTGIAQLKQCSRMTVQRQEWVMKLNVLSDSASMHHIWEGYMSNHTFVTAIEFPPIPWQSVAIDIYDEVQWAPVYQQFEQVAIMLVHLHTEWPKVTDHGILSTVKLWQIF